MISFENTIFDSAYKGRFDEIKAKVQESKDVIFSKDTNERLLIHWAALGGFPQIVKYLLDAGSPLDPRDDVSLANLTTFNPVFLLNPGDSNIGMTPLILASSANKLPVVQLLLQKGANVNCQNNEGHSALQYAASKGWKQVLEILIENGADVNIEDKRKATPLHRAASKGDTTTVSLLLTLGKNINVNVRDAYGNTPLHLACEENNAEVAELLIQSGAAVDIKNKEGKTPLELSSIPVQKKLIDKINSV